ncbi:LCI fold-containing protein [Photorhabdus luminescens]|uniref:LCI fold domain-containing protein n=1 Tax=Photorhabdus luminescens subsp. sonorensis TaxID=1173677 RepID=A0A5C4RL86_PHOLU|nr:LCI fold-containing protein [Photorhabdus luminescens]TNH44545.1 hypothetical protein EP164_04920 [Photorhabdus luminescens subsp. sonorensis]
MFKKLLTVGVLATALIGGIGTASAEFSGFTNCKVARGYDGGKPVRTVVHSNGIFANVFDRDGYRWYFKASKPCDNNKHHVALYEGRKI